MFEAVTSLPHTATESLSSTAFELLPEQGIARPAPYLQRAKWLALNAPDVLPDADIRAYLAEAHAIIAGKLTRKARAAIGLT